MNELRLGRYQDALADVHCDLLCVDAPYSAKTHQGHESGLAKVSLWKGKPSKRMFSEGRQSIKYSAWSKSDVESFVEWWGPRTRGWIVSITDHALAPVWASAMESVGRYVFAPMPLVETGSRVRLSGDGPSTWTCWIVVARPRHVPYSRWGTLPGAYVVPSESKPITGGKPLGAMRDIVRDYSREGDIVCDPCAGAGTTLLAARMEGRAYIGAEADPATHALATRRLAHMPTVPGQPALFGDP